MNSQRFNGLNGLRAISILLVIFNHLGMVTSVFKGLEGKKIISPLILFLQDGHLGVNIFFVISGFLITTLMLREESANGYVSVKKFYIRRLLRIFPAYYFLLLIYFILQIAGYLYIDGASWLTAITYTKYFNWDLGWYTAHAWSLSIEEHFYLLWPLVFTMLPKHRIKALWVLIILVPVIRFVTIQHPVSWMNDLSIFTRIDAIATGCLLAFYREKCISFLHKGFYFWFIISVAALIVLRNLSSDIIIQFDGIFTTFGTTHGTIANLFIGIIVLYAIASEKGFWVSFLNSALMNYVGLISYSLYLWQQFFISPYGKWVNGFPQNIILAFTAAILSYHVIERPFLRLKERFKMQHSEGR